MKSERIKFYADLLERTCWAFIAGFSGSYIAAGLVGSVQDLPTSGRFAIAAGAGLFSVFKSLAAVQLPWTASNSASVLPERLDPPAPVKPAPAKRTPRKRVARDDGQSKLVTILLVVILVLILIKLL